MIRDFLRATLILWAIQLAGTGLVHAAPAGYDQVLQTHETIVIGRHKVRVPVTIWLKTQFVTDAAHFNLWADIDLSGLQVKAPKIAGRMSRHKTCGDRIRVRRVSLKPAKNNARLCMRVHHERWRCLKAAMPSLSGMKLSFKEKPILKTRLVSQNAHVCAQMWPVIAKGGHQVRLEGKVTRNAISSKSGLLGNLFNAKGEFRSKLRRDVNRAVARFKLPVPDALQSFNPVVDGAKFRTRENGSLGLVLTMQVKVTSSELPQVLAALSSNN